MCGPFWWAEMNGGVPLVEFRPRLTLRMFDETRDGRAQRQRLCAGLLFAIQVTRRWLFEERSLVRRVWWPGGSRVSRVTWAYFGRTLRQLEANTAGMASVDRRRPIVEVIKPQRARQ